MGSVLLWTHILWSVTLLCIPWGNEGITQQCCEVLARLRARLKATSGTVPC